MTRLQLIGILILSLCAGLAQSQTRYVSDELVITFRTGPGPSNSITRNLTSGDRVEVLEERPDDGWARVRLDDGDEGWVLMQYLQPEPTANLLLQTARRDLTEAETEVEALRSQVSELQTELDATRSELEEIRSRSANIERELTSVRDASANALTIRDQNESLRERVSELTASADLAQMEIRELRSRNRQSWFIVGAAVLFGGVVIGLVAPSLRKKRRSSW